MMKAKTAHDKQRWFCYLNMLKYLVICLSCKQGSLYLQPPCLRYFSGSIKVALIQLCHAFIYNLIMEFFLFLKFKDLCRFFRKGICNVFKRHLMKIWIKCCYCLYFAAKRLFEPKGNHQPPIRTCTSVYGNEDVIEFGAKKGLFDDEDVFFCLSCYPFAYASYLAVLYNPHAKTAHNG